uniref:Uncharacterized protein n=1 Tax=Magnetococcus massalia (strain MO-1) TaxID=451514 RepID=A0A1S7LPV6_MAGMO|nr:Protein of unknown function [Candidatus Magnetococcus massalia]
MLLKQALTIWSLQPLSIRICIFTYIALEGYYFIQFQNKRVHDKNAMQPDHCVSLCTLAIANPDIS